MRTIKIRVWDVKNNGWVYTVPGNPDDHNVLGTVYFEDLYQDENDYIWEQYTGLKDKNGKDIYEGDIIKVIGYGLYEVFWRKWDSSFILRPIDASVVVENKVLMLCEDWEEDYEVIGNIHENPELLGGKE